MQPVMTRNPLLIHQEYTYKVEKKRYYESLQNKYDSNGSAIKQTNCSQSKKKTVIIINFE